MGTRTNLLIGCGCIFFLIIMSIVAYLYMRGVQTPTKLQPSFVGCYTDVAADRAFPFQATGPAKTFSECIDNAESVGSKTFGLQNGNTGLGKGTCFVGSNATTMEQIQRHGPSTECKQISHPNTIRAYPNTDTQVGLQLANAVYQLV